MKNVILTAILLGLFGFVFSGCETPMTESPENLEVELRSAVPVPFHAEYISTVWSTDPNPAVCNGLGAPVFNLRSTLEGKATHMGKITGSISSCVDPVTATIFNGEVILEAANGDQIYIFGGDNPLEINGGTGRFENATGWINASFELIGTNPPMFSEVMDGEIQY